MNETFKFVPTEALDGAAMSLRQGTTDAQVWADTFTGLYHVPPEIPAPKLVLDLGANIGLTAAHYRHMWPNAVIVALEPSAAAVEVGYMNAPNVCWVDGAVTGWDGNGYFDPSLPADSVRIYDTESANDAPVRCFTLWRLVEYLTLFASDIDFCKMDIEGSEWEVFEDGDSWRGRVSRLLVELHPGDYRPDDSDALVDEAIRTLTRLGYDAVRHDAHPRAVWAEYAEGA